MNTILNRRSGFTLVEMLIVLFIIVAVAAIFIPVVLNLTDRNQVPKGASMLENALHLAKSRAVAEKKPSGVRLMIAPNNLRNTTANVGFAWYDEIQYVEDPGDYVEHWVWGVTGNAIASVVQPFWSLSAGPVGPAAPSPGALPLGTDVVTIQAGPYSFNALLDSIGTTGPVNVNRQNCLFGPISIITGANQWNGASGTIYRSQRLQYSYLGPTPFAIQPGDRIEITGVGELFTVQFVSTTNVDISVAPSARIFVPIIVLDRPIPQNINVPLNGRPNYRVIRQPRAIPSLPPMKLPQDVVIDLTPSRQAFFGPPVPNNGDLDNSPTPSIYMSGISSGINISPISGITTTVPNNSIAPDYIDFMFAPSGELLPSSQGFRRTGPAAVQTGSFNIGSSGLIALWLHQRGDPNLWAARQITAAQGNADNQAIVAINARTGFIGSYPVDRSTVPLDPLANARLGKARTSADTGP